MANTALRARCKCKHLQKTHTVTFKNKEHEEFHVKYHPRDGGDLC